jgi:hypothetical protein
MAEQLIVMRPDEVRNYFAELKRDLIEEIRRSAKPAEVEQSVSAKEIAAHLKITTRTLWRRFRQGTYPPDLIHRDAGRPKFYKSEFEKYIKGN